MRTRSYLSPSPGKARVSGNRCFAAAASRVGGGEGSCRLPPISSRLSQAVPLTSKPQTTISSYLRAFLIFASSSRTPLISSPLRLPAKMSSSFRMLAALLLLSFFIASMADFSKDVDITWGDQRAVVTNNGQQLSLSLDKTSGSGFQSKQEFLFGRFDMKIKLVPGNSAGTVTAYYLSSQGPLHDEIDMEFLGNLSGQPYTLHTNVYAQGKGNREQQFHLWFDPTADFHTYSILWNPQQIMFYVDGALIRVFRNHESSGVSYPSKQAMRMYSSLWDAEDWATQGGRVKTDWTKAPFTASFRDVSFNGCVWTGSSSSCGPSTSGWMNQAAVTSDLQKMEWVQKNYMIYNYCNDAQRFPQGFPTECSLS